MQNIDSQHLDQSRQAAARNTQATSSERNDLPYVPTTMNAWRVKNEPGPIENNPLEWVKVPVPEPAKGEVLVKILACGVCRTDLHVSEGDLPVHLKHVTPGHEIVGQVVRLGPGLENSEIHIGQKVGVAWLRHTCGECEFCKEGKENLCLKSRYTGWDANGGYAQYAVAPADYTYPLAPLLDPETVGRDSEPTAPLEYSEATVAPLLCAGIIGYRALERTGLLDRYDHRTWTLRGGTDGGVSTPNRAPVLGLYGFGGSAHITAQVALALGMKVHVLTRGESSQKLALELGCSSARGAYDMPPEKLDAAIIYAPVGAMVPVAMRALQSGGVLSLAGIHMSDISSMNYENELFHEKEIRSVESNTRQDGREFLAFAAHHHIDVETHVYPLNRGQEALQDLKAGAFAGAAVLIA